LKIISSISLVDPIDRQGFDQHIESLGVKVLYHFHHLVSLCHILIGKVELET
jgi:hypothetical protein